MNVSSVFHQQLLPTTLCERLSEAYQWGFIPVWGTQNRQIYSQILVKRQEFIMLEILHTWKGVIQHYNKLVVPKKIRENVGSCGKKSSQIYQQEDSTSP